MLVGVCTDRVAYSMAQGHCCLFYLIELLVNNSTPVPQAQLTTFLIFSHYLQLSVSQELLVSCCLWHFS